MTKVSMAQRAQHGAPTDRRQQAADPTDRLGRDSAVQVPQGQLGVGGPPHHFHSKPRMCLAYQVFNERVEPPSAL